LAGQCPFTLRKVIRNGKNGITLEELQEVMNPEIRELEFSTGTDSIAFEEVKLNLFYGKNEIYKRS